MTIFKIVSFGIIATSLILVLKKQKSEIAIMCVIISSVIMLYFIFGELANIIELLNNLIEKSGINKEYLKIILKIVGISYIVEFGKNVCKDAGESAIANKIEMAGKVIIVSLSIPVISSLVEIVSVLL